MRTTLAGTRIRSLRTARRLAQGDLAQRAGISPSYLNLIEHNRRRPGPRVLAALARALDLDPAALDDATEDQVLAALRMAAETGRPDETPRAIAPELDRAEEFRGRFPGWAQLLVDLHGRAQTLERAVNRLSDRMAHDPNLSAALLEIVSAVTAVQSTSAILVEGDDMDPEWRGRFHANIHSDAVRLANAAEALVAYLDSTTEEAGLAAPLEELESWLEGFDFHVPAIEQAAPIRAADLTTNVPALASDASRRMAAIWLKRAQADARAMPLDAFIPPLVAMFDGTSSAGFSPDDLARQFGTSLSAVFRRLAVLPATPGVPRFGFLLCDASGTPIFRRPVDGFDMPRFGGGCPLLPLYQALMQPGRPLRQVIEVAGRPPVRYLAHAIAEPQGIARFDEPPVVEAAMLLTPVSVLGGQDEATRLGGQETQGTAGPPGAGTLAAGGPAGVPVGVSCRVCPRTPCAARREPSIVMR